MENENPPLTSYLKRQRVIGLWVFLLTWIVVIGGLIVLGDELWVAVVAVSVAVIGWLLGSYFYSHGLMISKKPKVYGIFIQLLLTVGGFLFLYHTWDSEFLYRDYDAGVVKVVLALGILFFPLLSIMVRYNYKSGVYDRMREKYNRSERGE